MSAKFTMQFDMDNAAFGSDSYATTTASLLMHVASRVARYETGGTILDPNGNKIGTWKLR